MKGGNVCYDDSGREYLWPGKKERYEAVRSRMTQCDRSEGLTIF
jgi:hypothetical protein